MVKILGKEVGQTGYGLMGLTWRAHPVPQETAFKAMKASLATGTTLWNGGEFYGPENRNSNHLLNEYFTKYPEDADKVVLCIKGGLGANNELTPNGSPENIKRSIDTCLRVLDGKKFIDLFAPARVDPNTPIEVTIAAIDEYVKAGKIGGISLSEVSAQSIRRAAKVAKISAVEVEFSLFSTDILSNGVAQACAELDIPIVAYSPISRGLLTGDIKQFDDLAAHDMRRHYPRFQPEYLDENLKLCKAVEVIAKRNSVTLAQVALAWVRGMSSKNGLPEIIPIPGSTTEARVLENSQDVRLTEEDMKDLDTILSKFEVKGARYGGPAAKLMEG